MERLASDAGHENAHKAMLTDQMCMQWGTSLYAWQAVLVRAFTHSEHLNSFTHTFTLQDYTDQFTQTRNEEAVRDMRRCVANFFYACGPFI